MIGRPKVMICIGMICLGAFLIHSSDARAAELRENEVENVVVVGTKTNCCIRATVTDAFYLNYNPYVIRECVATNSETVNEVHLTDIDKYLGKVIDMNTFSKMLEEGQL